MGDMVGAVDRRIGAISGGVGPARVRVGIRGRRMRATAHAYASRRARRSHLTRRGQFVLVAFAAVVALAVAGFLVSRSGATTQRPEPVGQRSIVVQPGQTLWSIAKDVAPGRDIREVIYEIRHINGLDSGMLRSGQTLVLPSG